MIATVRPKGIFAVIVGSLIAAVVLGGCSAGTAASPRRVVIPLRARETDLAGAFALLRGLGLRVAVDQSVSYASLRSAWVAKLSPGVGAHVDAGSVVTITPSALGPIGSPAVLKSHPHYRVPSFIGGSAATAIAWANDHHMFWSIPALPVLPASNAPTLFAAYRVTAQTPKPGETIVQGIMVGKGFRPTPLTLALHR